MTIPVKVWRYVIPSDEHREGWGVLILDSTGYFSAVSDYGNYAYLWNAHGTDDFRKFAIRLERDWDYAATKLGGYDKNHRLDVEATAKQIKRAVLEGRRSRRFSAEEARQEWDEARDLDVGNITPEQWYERTALGDATEYWCYRRDSDLEAFCKKLLPRLSKIIATEMAAEKPAKEHA